MASRLSARALVDLTIPTEVAISPDGGVIAIVASQPDWETGDICTHLWLWRKGELRQWTFNKEQIRSPRFSPDGKWLAFLAQRGGDREKGEAKAQLWVLPLDGGESRCLTNAEEGVVTFAWHPDSVTLWCVIPRAKPQEQKNKEEVDRKRKRDYTYHDEPLPARSLWRFKLPEGKGEEVFQGDAGLYEVVVAPDGKRLVFATTFTGKRGDWRRSKLFWLPLDDNLQPSAEPMSLADRAGMQTTPRVSPDSQRVAFLSWLDPNCSFSHERVFVADWQGKWTEWATLPDLEPDLGILHWTQAGLLTVLATGTTSQLWRLTEEEAESLSEDEWLITALDSTPDGRTFAAIRTDERHPPDVWLGFYEGDRLSWERVSEFNPKVRQWRLPSVQKVRWQSADGVSIEGLLWLPPEQPDQPKPLVVWVHGGPKSRATKALLSAMGVPVLLAVNGYTVLTPNFRGSGGYSNEFAVANFRDLGGGDFRDILAGVEWCIEQGIADPHRVGIIGGSYGGYMTNWALTQSERFKAGVSLFGIALLFSDFGNSDNPSWEPDYLGGLPWEATDLYTQRSPFLHAHRITAPLLLLHGESDTNTFVSNSQEMFTALKQLSRRVEFVRYPREGHGFREPHHRVDALERILRWFDQWLKGDLAASAVPLGEVVSDEVMQVRVLHLDDPVEVLNGGHKPNERFVSIALEVAALKEGAHLALSKEVRLLDENGHEHAPAGILCSNGQSSWLVEGELRLPIPSQPVEVRLAFRLPKGERPALFQVRDQSLQVWEARKE